MTGPPPADDRPASERSAIMQPELREHAPRARCYECGIAETGDKALSLCHHCGKAMCGQHRPKVLGPDGKPVSREFAGLDLAPSQSGGYHCEEHAHVVKADLRKVIVVGVALAVVGVGLAFASLVFGLVLLIAGAGLAVAGYRANQSRTAAARAAQPDLPVIPSLESISVRETLHGRVQLAEDGTYTSPLERVDGELEVKMTLTKADRERLEAYRRTYGLTAGERVGFSAGFAVIKGEAGLSLAAGEERGAIALPGGTGVWFRGEAASHPLFSTTGGRSGTEWVAKIPYQLQAARKPKSIPIWLVPSLVPESDQRTLELDVHWVELGEDDHRLQLAALEEIELIVPKDWGNVESVSPTAFIGSAEDEIYRVIKWKQPSPVRQQGQSITLAIRFEEQIKQIDALRGRLKASFNGALSGIEDIAFHRPLSGNWQNPPKASVKTEVSVDFELSLNSIRYQDVRVVPDRNKDITDPAEAASLGVFSAAGQDPDQRSYRPEVEEFPDVTPDYRTVIELTNEMSRSGYYVKRVTENQPGGGGRADQVDRVWDIVGRYYSGVFPVDFHITLSGEEEYRGSGRANAGHTTSRITVWGSYVDTPMERKIVGVWDTLHRKVTDTMADRAAAAPVITRSYPADPQPASARTADRRVDDARAAALRKRLDSITEALLEGRITEQTYQELKADIRRELGES
jgi:hypothetical protein